MAARYTWRHLGARGEKYISQSQNPQISQAASRFLVGKMDMEEMEEVEEMAKMEEAEVEVEFKLKLSIKLKIGGIGHLRRRGHIQVHDQVAAAPKAGYPRPSPPPCRWNTAR